MDFQEVAGLISGAVLVVTAAITIVDWARRRDSMRLDVALLFSGLGIIVIIGRITDVTGEIWVLSRIVTGLLMLHPYFLVRVVHHFRPVPRLLERVALVALGLAAALIFPFREDIPSPVLLYVVACFVAIEGYCVVEFARGLVAGRGVTRMRLLFAAIASGALATLIFLAGLLQVVTPTTGGEAPSLGPVGPIISIVVVVSLYLAFAAPLWLRHHLQTVELRTYLTSQEEWKATDPMAEKLHGLCVAAMRLVGGFEAVYASPAPGSRDLVVAASASGRIQEGKPIGREYPTIHRAWRDGLSHVSTPVKRADLHGAPTRRAENMIKYSVPLSTADRKLGVLAVYVWHGSLFPDDDLDALQLLDRNTATALGYTLLLETQEKTLRQLTESNTLLEEKIRALQTANSHLESFSYSISHDLRAPLRHITAMSRILSEENADALNADGRRQLQIIIDSAKRMGNLFDDLLSFSRSARQEIRLRPVNVNAVVSDCLSDMRGDIDGRNLTLDVADDLPEAVADGAMLGMVYANLLGNAVKYTRPRGEARIEIGWMPGKNYGPTVYFVRDNGVGFDMRYSNKLFGVFQRLHSASEFEGTGVGLAIAHRIITRHGGAIWADAAVDKGATFYFTLGASGEGNVSLPEGLELNGSGADANGTDSGGGRRFSGRRTDAASLADIGPGD